MKLATKIYILLSYPLQVGAVGNAPRRQNGPTRIDLLARYTTPTKFTLYTTIYVGPVLFARPGLPT